jgi:hypothetical protein
LRLDFSFSIDAAAFLGLMHWGSVRLSACVIRKNDLRADPANAGA